MEGAEGWFVPAASCGVAVGVLGNLAAAELGEVTRAVKGKLKMLQYGPEVFDGCLAGSG